MLARLIGLAAAALVGGCTGYQLGGAQPVHLAAIETIDVQMVRNQTQMPRAAAHATNALIDALTRDGTYRLATADIADARLETILVTIDYQQVSSARSDTLRSEELEMEITLSWALIDADTPGRVLQQGRSRGATRFFVDPNLQTARQTALTDALKRASESVVARLADGF